MIDFELVVDEMIVAARAAILDGDVLELEPSQFIDCMIHLMEKLRKSEKDAARYRWLRDDADGHQLRGCMELNGEDWDSAVDRVMQCK